MPRPHYFVCCEWRAHGRERLPVSSAATFHETGEALSAGARVSAFEPFGLRGQIGPADPSGRVLGDAPFFE
uniref:Uncharacterized protein n=1 Tax=Globodera rostochiensis TaxID=31243 RepID=A0A914HJA0_GLORO